MDSCEGRNDRLFPMTLLNTDLVAKKSDQDGRVPRLFPNWVVHPFPLIFCPVDLARPNVVT